MQMNLPIIAQFYMKNNTMYTTKQGLLSLTSAFFIRLGCFFMTCTRRMNDFLDGDEPKWNMNTHNTHVRGYEGWF